jgi:DNA polymerase-3 subunit delta'
MKFIGNKKAVTFLERVIRNDAVSHAYIFFGPSQVGKRTLAELFARAIISGGNFDADELEEGGVNDEYRLDLKIVSPVTEEKGGVLKQKDISISQIREASQFLIQYPYLNRKKILIINDAHKMTVSAQNCLLKVLEEPNSTSMLILVAEKIDNILTTLQSRCQKVSFVLVSEAEIRKTIFNEGKSVEEGVLLLGMGRPGHVIEILHGDNIVAEKIAELESLSRITEMSLTSRLQMAEKYSKNIPETVGMLRAWIWKLYNEKETVGVTDPHVVIKEIEKCIEMMVSTNANARLVLEKLFLSI